MELKEKLKTKGFEFEEENDIICVNIQSFFKNILIYISFDKEKTKWNTTTKFLRFGDIIKQTNKCFVIDDKIIDYLIEIENNIHSVSMI
jgi:hypothetical protein